MIRIIMYVLAVIIPIVVIIMEMKGIIFSELIYITLAKLVLYTKNTKQAKTFLINLINKYPGTYKGHKMLAEIYEKEGGMRKAIDEYIKAVDIHKQDYDSYYKVAYLLNQLDKKDESIHMLNELLNKNPYNIEAIHLLGDIYYQQERYKEALGVYIDSLRYYPNDYNIYYNMGMVYSMLNDFSNAKICYEKAATINSLLYNSYYNIAQINMIFGDLEEAEVYFQKSLIGEEIEPKAYYNLARIYMLRGEKENAINFINLAIELDNMYIKISNEEPIFIPIKSRIRFPIIDEEDIIPKKYDLSNNEIRTQMHLEDTYKIVGKLSYNELKVNQIINIKNNKNKDNDKQR